MREESLLGRLSVALSRSLTELFRGGECGLLYLKLWITFLLLSLNLLLNKLARLNFHELLLVFVKFQHLSLIC